MRLAFPAWIYDVCAKYSIVIEWEGAGYRASVPQAGVECVEGGPYEALDGLRLKLNAWIENHPGNWVPEPPRTLGTGLRAEGVMVEFCLVDGVWQ